MRTFAPSPLATDEIERIWLEAAQRIGFRVSRTAEAYATSDGRGGIAIGVPDLLDVDDAVAQLVFHELCHAITEGPRAQALPDWGLDNDDSVADRVAGVVREHACLRVQAHLADRFGLRALMAPTTEYRAYYDEIGEALGDDGGAPDPAVAAALEAAARAARSPWSPALEEALAATAAVLERLGRVLHPLGFPLGPAAESCGTCAWMYVGGRGKSVARCRQSAPANADGARVRGEMPACARWEAPVNCQSCGACCREAYHVVSVSVRDPMVWKQPALIERHGHRFQIRREGPRCAALVDRREGPAPDAAPLFACTIYEDRPQTCRDFARGGRHCLDARRRVGLSARAEPRGA